MESYQSISSKMAWSIVYISLQYSKSKWTEYLDNQYDGTLIITEQNRRHIEW